MSESIRLDKWLWAARFYKMRGLATDAIKHGQIQVNGQRPKPSRTVRPNDEIQIDKAGQIWTVRVTKLMDKRGSAVIAQSMYEESAASKARREQQGAQRRAEWLSRPQPPEHRPDRRERARLRKLLQKI